MRKLFGQRATQAELMDDLALAGDDLRKNLKELAFINRWLGGHAVITSALNQLFPTLKQLPGPVTFADVGCGGGDTLLAIAHWAKNKQLPAHLTGIDANAFMLDFAAKNCSAFRNISLVQHNVFSEVFAQQQFQVIVCSLFCHHFSDEALVRLFRQLYAQTGTAVIINDLHRHPLAYFSIKYLTRWFSGSYLVKNDAPLSVLRAFRRPELELLLQKAGITTYNLRWQWAFRWQLVLYKQGSA